ncbi:MAG: MFS transporter [Euryarchaeota archaeon]|nr:MFS transporter [Euryarchaeota archaeon]MDE1837058.1 MFS transporter [Euryarchaeota archaeon]MDE1880989.1 MFS transporter [Euryarchaeota archaeon]MDE2046376.1 MFS transporter [Thermoplasmata archaeon]
MVARKWVALSNTTIGTFMALLDTSIVLISLPTIGRELPGTPPEVLLWVVLTYSLVTTTLLLSLGRLSDMFGRVRLYTLGFAVFTIGSGLASLSTSGAFLLSARIVQGVGAGLLSSNSAAILTDAFPPRERGRALGINQVAAIGGGMLGLVLGGVLTTTLGWRSIFWVNLPIGTFGTIWAYRALPRTPSHERQAPIDWRGNLSFAVGITAALVGVTLGGLQGWGSPVIIFLLVAGIASLLLFLGVERRVASPMFQLSLFRIRTFAFGNLAALFSALARGAFSFIMVFYFQGVLFQSPLSAGLMLLPLSAAFVVAGPISGAVSDLTGARILGTAGLLLSSLGFLVLLEFQAHDPYWQLAAAMVMLGVGQGMFAAPNRAEVMSSVPPERRGVASGMGMTFLQAGNLGSLAMGFTILAGVVPTSTLASVFAGGSGGAPPDVGAFMSALHVIFAVGFVLTLLAAGANAVRGRSDRGEERPLPGARSPTLGSVP